MADGRAGRTFSAEHSEPTQTSRPTANGRLVSRAEARAAAKTKISVDKKLGRTTATWVKNLADE